ncbi:hypothetical protein QUF50_09370 [Thiotrichales bacterium HSG1]|nr:hypothetical protein [Thiotrichales bacterium HSG1]
MRIKQPIDPIIGKRVRITDNSHFTTKWLYILSIIAIIIGGVYVSSSIVESLMFNNEYENSLNAKHVTVSNKFVETSTNPIKKVNSNNISNALLKDYSLQNNTGFTPVKLPVESIAQLAIKSEVNSTSTTQNTDLKSLLELANKQIAMKRLTSPKGDNAYETYKVILKQDSQTAQKILDDIVNWYLVQGENFISNDRTITELNGRSSAYKMYQKLLKIAPNHQNTQTLFSDIIVKFDKRIKQHLKDDALDDACTTYQEMFKVAPNNRKTKQVLTRITNQLFAKAKNQIIKQQYSTPENDNAVATFEQILAISPDSNKAKKGLKKIVKRYYSLALRRHNQGRYKGSMTWLERGLVVSSNDHDLNKLKQLVIKKLK